jgi:hypothetical protein
MAEILEVKTVVETKQAEQSVDNLTDKIEGGTEATQGMIGALDKMTGGAITAFRGIVKGAQSGVMAMRTLKGAIAATGIGLLVLAVGSLISHFTNTQKGSDLLDKAFAGIGATIDVVIDRLSTFGGGLMEIFSGNFSAGLDILAGSFKGITAEIKAEAAAAVDLEDASQKLLKTKRDFIEQEAKLNADLQKYRLESENFDLSTADRLAANNKAQETAMELANKQTEIAKEELRILSEKNALGESMNDDLDAEAEAKARLFEIEGRRDKLSKGFQAKEKSIRAEAKGAAQAAAAEAKTIQDAKNAKSIEDAKITAKAVEDARLEAIKDVDNQIREYKLTHDEVKLADLLTFEEKKKALELEQLNISEAEKEAIRLSYKEKEVAATNETKDAEAKISEDAKNKQLQLEQDKQAAINAGAEAGFALLGAMAEKNNKASKAIAVAQVMFDTIRGIQSTFASASANVAATTASMGAYPFIQAGAAAAFGALSIRKILSTPTNGGGGGGVGGSTPSAPSVNVSNTPRIPNFNAMNEGVGGRDGFGSVRAVVIQQDIKDSASLDNRVDDLIKIGK